MFLTFLNVRLRSMTILLLLFTPIHLPGCQQPSNHTAAAIGANSNKAKKISCVCKYPKSPSAVSAGLNTVLKYTNTVATANTPANTPSPSLTIAPLARTKNTPATTIYTPMVNT